ncbi:Predicted hydrolase or acyltransferase [Oleispira antarctica RB-8]|uniref:Predicted hydrolase or acyltransferase n=1 Tax=Oleispira antarctica RB-8 TaxID=698738 RepID=R4YP04_OLEAN|nr:Predicted hydrolase or acyltransferase [Oleispira antarctica RB-8]
MKLIILLLTLSLTACADWQDTLFELGVDVERSMSNLSEHSVSTADHEWVYLSTRGDVDPSAEVVIMLHGFAVDKDNWIRFARNFPNHRVIIPDLPGHGETSYNPELVYDFHNQARWLNDFIEQLQLTKFHLIGNSMGGGIAAYYAHDYSDKVSSIVLIDAAGVHPPQQSKLQQIIENNEPNPLIIRTESDFDRLQEFAMEDQPFLPWPASGVLARKSMARQGINDKIFADINDYAERVKVSKENLKVLSEIQQPTFILWGKEDRALDVSSVQVFEEYLPNASSFIMEGVGHGPMIERPEESAALVLGFLKSLERKVALEESL